ncbi:hypothetical protein [Parvularcula maris]|uniref:Glycerophosphoryl diester phosphodiesterase membrane domain-containing protein n=1 Tax=Parvularcula maris TaxID=2965077 RepID=A0A9X2L9A7_9PROT|nr:hypothetical protein [Parvularcula maris]MCQ8185434.1 hypothetical protein [Parvularcula maris]
MRPNFHAIEAIAYGLGYGIKGLPTFFRLGWLPLLLLTGIAFFLMQQGVDFNFGGTETGANVEVTEEGMFGSSSVFMNKGFEINPEEWTGSVILASAGALLALILFVPALVAMTREAAGVEVRGGFLPAFGSPEVAYLVAVILSVLIFLLVILVAALGIAVPLGISGALLEGQLTEDSIGPIAIILILAFIAFLIWFGTRFSLFSYHAAVTGRIAPLEAFGLTGGRFWKLFGSWVLISIVVGLLGGLIELIGLGFAAFNMVFLPLLLQLVSQIYQSVAQTGFAGRVVGDLMATREHLAAENV